MNPGHKPDENEKKEHEQVERDSGKSAEKTVSERPKTSRSGGKSRKSGISEVNPLAAAVEQKEKEITLLKDQLLRTAADFENYRKRRDRESGQLVEEELSRFIRGLLPVIDDFERSLKTSLQDNPESFRRGIELIVQKLQGILENAGVVPMQCIGEPFDVHQHDAMALIEKPDFPKGVVVDEHEKGYLWNGKVLRHAKVIVSK